MNDVFRLISNNKCIRLFIGGFEIGKIQGLSNMTVESEADWNKNNIDSIIKFKFECNAKNVKVEDGCLFIGEIPSAEFIKRMVDIRMAQENPDLLRELI